MRTINTVIFDLDGTLLDTLQDLSDSVNHALRTYGLPERTTAEIRNFLGNGIRRLVENAVPAGTDEALFEKTFACFREHYVRHCLDKTKPYPGIMPLLKQLKADGYRMAIVSNKWYTAVEELNARFFKDYMAAAVGESEAVRRKPNPDAVLAAMERLGSRPEESIYVGDSEVDIAVARNAGIPCVSVLWGFRDEECLKENGASRIIRQPEELLAVLKG